MKQHIGITVDGEYIAKFDEYIGEAGLSKSGYLNGIIIKDVSYLNSVIDGKNNPNEIKQMIVNYFRRRR